MKNEIGVQFKALYYLFFACYWYCFSVDFVQCFNKVFFSGLDSATASFLHSQAVFIELDDTKQSVKIGDITVTAHWNDLPKLILDHFDESKLVPNTLAKEVEGYPVFSPPDYVYFLLKVQENDKVKYVSMVLNERASNSGKADEFPLFLYVVFIAAGALMIFSVVLFVIFKQVTVPVEALMHWAKTFSETELKKPTPDFNYSELNILADIIKSSLNLVQNSLEREKRFLGYASHELRTPIAITRTNAELLQKMIEKNINQEKQLEVLDRIERAGVNMTALTETLLWLNRQEDKALPKTSIVLGVFIKQIVHDLNYLLQGKTVELTIATDNYELQVPDALCRIIITNLIRNAFQYTHSGHVIIQQVNHRIAITNKTYDSDNNALINNELMSGLGLELTEKLVNKYGWLYRSFTIEEGYFVELDIAESLTYSSNN